MTVTILVPIYNVERYIAACAESLFRQTYADIEYVFCDDCTPDSSMSALQEVVERYPERAPHVRIIANDRNLGLGGTRRHLLQQVQTEAFCIVDSDDILPPDAIRLLVQRMEETGADIIEGAYSTYNNGQLSEPILPANYTGEQYLRCVLCQNIIENNVWRKLYRREIVEKVGAPLFFEGIDYSEDYCATARLAAVASRAWTNEVVYHYRTDNISSYTKTISPQSMYSYFRANAEVLRFFSTRGEMLLAMEIGIMNCYRECHRNRVSMTEADGILQYKPHHAAARMLHSMFHSALPYSITDLAYRLIRRFA